METFNGSLRDECLNVHWFASMAEARTSIEAWRQDYNESRPHMAHGYASPGELARRSRHLADRPGAKAPKTNASDGPDSRSGSEEAFFQKLLGRGNGAGHEGVPRTQNSG